MLNYNYWLKDPAHVAPLHHSGHVAICYMTKGMHSTMWQINLKNLKM